MFLGTNSRSTPLGFFCVIMGIACFIDRTRFKRPCCFPSYCILWKEVFPQSNWTSFGSVSCDFFENIYFRLIKMFLGTHAKQCSDTSSSFFSIENAKSQKKFPILWDFFLKVFPWKCRTHRWQHQLSQKARKNIPNFSPENCVTNKHFTFFSAYGFSGFLLPQQPRKSFRIPFRWTSHAIISASQKTKNRLSSDFALMFILAKNSMFKLFIRISADFCFFEGKYRNWISSLFTSHLNNAGSE